MFILDSIKRIRKRILATRMLKSDVECYRDFYSSCIKNESFSKKYERGILVHSHVIEKGLSHEKIKPLFGYERVKKLSDALNHYLSYGGDDSFIIGIGLSALDKYNTVNAELGVREDLLIPVPNISQFGNVDRVSVGVSRITKSDLFKIENYGFRYYANNRHSVRLYDCKSLKIDRETIIECIEIAQNCPNACNRQSVRVKVIQDEDKIRQICEIQGGCKGFGENSGALLIITVDISLYNPVERRIPLIDCGIFIMNILYALFDKKIGTCVLHGSFSYDREMEMRELVPIPENEMYAALIALSNIPENANIMITNSPKRRVEDIVSFL